MKVSCISVLSLLQSTLAYTAASHLIKVLGPQGVNLLKLEAARRADASKAAQFVAQGFAESISSEFIDHEFPTQWFLQPLDHFSKSDNHTFRQRYWVNKRYYKPGTGAPVIVLDGGETSGEVRSCTLNTTQTCIIQTGPSRIGFRF